MTKLGQANEKAKDEYLKEARKLKRAHIRKADTIEYGTIARMNNARHVVILEPFDVNNYGCIRYNILILNAVTRKIEKADQTYGFEELTPTGDGLYNLKGTPYDYDDIL